MDNLDKRVVRAIALALGLITLLLYLPAASFDFLNYDDPLHLTENEIVKKGLTWEGIQWAFTGSAVIFWHPITWLSHMLDVQLFGLNAGAHHTVNIIIHLLSVVALFYALLELTGKWWPCALIAGWFAWHPLHVESVAWIAERKDVLSGLFFNLTLLAYARFVKQTDRRWYWTALAFFTLGIMSKTMLVTLPVILLLLDYWPLQRFQPTEAIPASLKKLLLEKWPFFALALVAVIMTVGPAAESNALRDSEQWEAGFRVRNALVSVINYLEMTCVPVNLSVYYPTQKIHLLQAGLAAIILLGITAWCYTQRKKSPWWLLGWLWFLIMLLPVLGLIKVGSHAMADRYTYLPLIGIFAAIAFTLDDLLQKHPTWKTGIFLAAGLSLLACVAQSHRQLLVWRNSITLFEHALQVTKNNAVAHYNLASALMDKNRPEEALPHYEAVMKLRPNREDVHYNYARALMKTNRLKEAETNFTTTIEYNPANIDARMNLGNLLYLDGNIPGALEQFRQVVRYNPNHDGALNNLGLILFQQGNLAEARKHFMQAIKVSPKNPEAHFNLGRTLVRLGEVDAGAKELLIAAQLAPESPNALLYLGWTLATYPAAKYRRGAQAVILIKKAMELTGPNDIATLDALAAAYAENGQFKEAIQTATQALNLANVNNDAHFAQALELRIKSYEKGEPWRQAP